jgi:uncharacterized protein YuzB (UPF0349 family)
MHYSLPKRAINSKLKWYTVRIRSQAFENNNMKEEDNVKSFITKMFSKEKQLTIEFCQNNLDLFVNEEIFPAYQQFLTQPSVEFKEFECLSQCKLCKKSAYAKVDGEIIVGEGPDDLLKKLKNNLKLNF